MLRKKHHVLSYAFMFLLVHHSLKGPGKSRVSLVCNFLVLLDILHLKARTVQHIFESADVWTVVLFWFLLSVQRYS